MRSNLQENFYKRLKELGGVKSSNNPSASLSNSTLIDYTRSNDGVALGIVKENHNYFIKTSSNQNEKIGAEDFAYIGGVENKYKYQYSSLAEAEKNRNFYIKTLNESSSKKFKTIAINEGENISKAQVNADSLKADKAQAEADKGKGSADLKDTAKEKEIGAVPSVAAISVKKEAPKAKVVDDTKESNAAAISVKKQAKNVKVVKEGFEPEAEEEVPAAEPEAEMPVADAGAEVPAEGSEASAEVPAEGGDETADLDAAAGALADMGAAEPAAEVPAGDAGAEPAAEVPAGDAGAEDGEVPTDAEASVKDIEKLTGKVTQKIRSTVMTPELTKGFLKSYITAFEDKINDLEHEDRKELANAILKDKEEGDAEAAPVADDEAEIEEAINQHLAEMGIGGDEEPVETGVKTFESYIAERGYSPEKVDEISLMEMVGLMNGYTNECGEEGADAEGMSNYATPDVMAKLQESGNALFEDLMKPFGEKIKNNKKDYATEAVIPTINEEFGEEEEEESEEGGEEEKGAEGIEIGGDDEGVVDGMVLGGEEEESEPAISIAPAADAIAIGTPMTGTMGGQSKSVTVDLKNDTINLTMNEAEAKLRKIVQKKIAEQLSGKKPAINESKKSALSIMIDELVNEAIVKRRAAIEARLLRK